MLQVSTFSLDNHEKLCDSRMFQAQGSMRIVDRPFAADSCPVSLDQTNNHRGYACLDMTEVAEEYRLRLEHLEATFQVDFQGKERTCWLQRRTITYRPWHAISCTHEARVIDCAFESQVLAV